MWRAPTPPTTSVSASSRAVPRGRTGYRFLAAAPFLILSACVSFRVTVPPVAELAVAFLAVVTEVDESGDFDRNIASQPVRPDADSVFALIKIKRIPRSVSLSWRWYAPDDSLVRASPPVIVNARKAELEHAVAWDRLAGQLFSGHPGSWRVVVCADDRYLTHTEFTVPPVGGGTNPQLPE